MSASLGADLFLPLKQEPEIGYGLIAGGSPVIDFKQTGSQGKRINQPPLILLENVYENLAYVFFFF